MRELTIYVDESGNSGDASSAGAAAPGDQPVFALVGLAEEAGSGSLASLLEELRLRHGIKSLEIKGRTMNRRPKLVPDLLRELHDRRIPMFVELMDKRYFVATNVVNHVLGKTWLDVSSRGSLALANAFADTLAEEIDEQVLVSYGEFAMLPSPTTFEVFVETFRQALFLAKVRIGVEREGLFELVWMMEKALESSIEAVEDLSFDEFLPAPDWDARGNRLPMLPHVPALTNMYARINRFSKAWSGVRVLHDEQAQFGPLLAGYASILESNRHVADLARSAASQHVDWDFSAVTFDLTFGKSEDEPGIQLADVIARFCNRQLAAIIANGTVAAQLVQVAPLLRALRDATESNGINVVSTTKRASCFHGA